MMGQRRLLYHRGVDDNVGTYVSDYVLSFISFGLTVFLVALVIVYSRCTRHHSAAGKRIVARTTYATVLLLTFIGVLTLCGGLTHQYLQTVADPFESAQQDAWSWLVLWRTAFAFSSGIAFAFLMYPQQLLAQEDIIRPGRWLTSIYYIVVSGICLSIAIHSFMMLSNKADPFHATPMFAALFSCCLVDCFVSSLALCVLCRRRRNLGENESHTSCLEKLTSISSRERRLSDKSAAASTDESEANEPLSLVNSNSGNSDVRWDVLLHVAGSAIFILGGLAQFFLAKQGCADPHDNPNGLECPLPFNFNHNAVLHTMHILSVFLFFTAEMLSLRRYRSSHHVGRPVGDQTPV